MDDEKKNVQLSVTDLEAIKDNTEQAVNAFAKRYLSMPRFTEHCEVMDQGQLRDAMGLRATFDSGDPWPRAEQLLIEQYHFRWHNLGGIRVMYLQERGGYEPDDGWNDGEELTS